MKAGLEVHQQLATGKLFCACPSNLSEPSLGTIRRRLLATRGEESEIDPAARAQAGREFVYEYEVAPESCLVELDEEPPHAINPEALDVALTIALLLNARVLDEIEVMRKIVVDGSNTSGFQRTALIAVDGTLEARGRRYSIPTICLEEDAARKVGEKQALVRYRLDRLGIPLIEIATGPEIHESEEARFVAEEIGALLRATGRVRRGIGTIREDLNVSVTGGARVEIKGVQELRLIHRYVDLEVARQEFLLELRDRLNERGAKAPDGPPLDVTDLVRAAPSGPIAEAVRRGGVVLGLRLPGFAGFLGPQPGKQDRFGRELADRARAAGLRGLLHSDELPGPGLDASSVQAIRPALGVEDPDGFILIAAPSLTAAERAMALVRERAVESLEGVLGETRDPLPDGRSRYSRPLPGRNRMYPETDVPPVRVGLGRIERLRRQLPERPESIRARLQEKYELSQDLAHQLVRGDDLALFEALAAQGHPANLVARVLTQDLPAAMAQAELTDEHLPLDPRLLNDLLEALRRGEFAKEAVPRVLGELLRGRPSVTEAARSAGLLALSPAELESIAEALLVRNEPLVRERGEEAFQPLMGDLMREVRGRRDGEEVATVLRKVLGRHVRGMTPNS